MKMGKFITYWTLVLAFLVALPVSGWGLDWHIKAVDPAYNFANQGLTYSLAIDQQGYPHLAYGGDGLYYEYWNGTKWIIKTVDDSPNVGTGAYASFALDTNGNPHIAYTDHNGHLKYAYYKGSSWHKETIDSNQYFNFSFPSLVLDSSGTPHVAYLDHATRAIKYAHNNDGTGWNINVVDSNGTAPSLALDTNGHPHIAYNDNNGNLKYAHLNGNSWNIETVSSDSYSPSLAIEASGNPHIAYYNLSNHRLKYAYFTGNSWNIETVDTLQMQNQVGFASLVLDSNGNPHIAYYDLSPSYQLKYAYYDGNSWQIETVDSLRINQSGYISLALDSNDYPHIIYPDWHNDYLKYAHGTPEGWMFRLWVNIEEDEWGSVISNPPGISCPEDCNEDFLAGTSVTLTAIPREGYTFAGWGDACDECGSNQECTIYMNQHKSCTALFANSSNQPPVIDSFTAQPTFGEAPLEVVVTCNATDPEGCIGYFEIDPGDGTGPRMSEDYYGGTMSWTFNYENPGTYQVTCTVHDCDSKSATSTLIVTAATWNDITEGISYTRSRTLYDRINRAFFVLIDVTNDTGTDIEGPVRMVLVDPTLDLKTGGPGLDPDGYTEAGEPYFIIVPEGESLGAGETLEDLRLDFVLKRARLTFGLRFEALGTSMPGPQPM